MRSTWTMTSKLRALNLALGLGLLGSFAAGCLVTNQNHCGLNQGACGAGQMCSVCEVDNNGCVPSETVLESGCAFGGGTTSGPTSATDTTITTTSSPTTTESTVDPSLSTETADVTTTIGPTSMVTLTTTEDPSDTSTETTVGPMCVGDVVDNPACAGETPYCVDGNCVGCTSLNCNEIDPKKPACAQDLGLCVECLSNSDCLSEDKPVCDGDTATCKPCSEHEECETTACDLETGMCLPDSCVFFVDHTKGGDHPCNDAADGLSPDSPLCTLPAAAARLQEGKPCTIKVKVGTQFQSLPTVIEPGAITVAIIQYGNSPPSLSVTPDPAITISAGNRVYMSRIAITNTSNPAIECEGGILWLDNQRIFNTKTAMHVKDCKVHIRRSIIFGHTAGGLDIQGTAADSAHLWVENSYITSMTSSTFGAIRLLGLAKADLLYTTIALVKSVVPPIECWNGFTGAINIRNSAIIGAMPLYGAACMGKVSVTTSHESFETTQADLADTFSSFNGGQFQALSGGLLEGKAKWLTGDPKKDQDGTARPKMNDEEDYAGADRPAQ